MNKIIIFLKLIINFCYSLKQEISLKIKKFNSSYRILKFFIIFVIFSNHIFIIIFKFIIILDNLQKYCNELLNEFKNRNFYLNNNNPIKYLKFKFI